MLLFSDFEVLSMREIHDPMLDLIDIALARPVNPLLAEASGIEFLNDEVDRHGLFGSPYWDLLIQTEDISVFRVNDTGKRALTDHLIHAGLALRTWNVWLKSEDQSNVIMIIHAKTESDAWREFLAYATPPALNDRDGDRMHDNLSELNSDFQIALSDRDIQVMFSAIQEENEHISECEMIPG